MYIGLYLKALRFVAVAAMLLSANIASAGIILTWDSTSSSSNSPATGASATATLSFFDEAGGAVRIEMLIRNTTGELPPFGAGATESMLTGIAFDLVANSGVDNFVAGAYLDTLILGAILEPFGTLDMGIADNDNFVGGNANDALPQATSDTSSINVNGTGLSAADLEIAFNTGFTDGSLGYVARFMQVNAGAGSDKLSGPCCEPGGPGEEIPVPGTLLLLGLGLLGLRFRARA